jgi:hypothetical protein
VREGITTPSEKGFHSFSEKAALTTPSPPSSKGRRGSSTHPFNASPRNGFLEGGSVLVTLAQWKLKVFTADLKLCLLLSFYEGK